MEIVRSYYDNGQIEEEYCLINNKKEGLYKKYRENVQLFSICNCSINFIKKMIIFRYNL